MRLVNEKTEKVYEARILSEKKVPKFVRGNYVDQNIKIDGKNVAFKYDKDRKTGLYFWLNGKPLYFAERDILTEKNLVIGDRANAAKVVEEKPVKPRKTKKTEEKQTSEE